MGNLGLLAAGTSGGTFNQISEALQKFATNGKVLGPGIAVFGLLITGIMIAIPVKSIREFGKENAFYIILATLLIAGAVTIGSAIAGGWGM